MSDNVVDFTGVTYGEIPISNILDNAPRDELETVILIGKTKDGLPYFASSTGEYEKMLWMVELFKQDLLLN